MEAETTNDEAIARALAEMGTQAASPRLLPAGESMMMGTPMRGAPVNVHAEDAVSLSAHDQLGPSAHPYGEQQQREGSLRMARGDTETKGDIWETVSGAVSSAGDVLAETAETVGQAYGLIGNVIARKVSGLQASPLSLDSPAPCRGWPLSERSMGRERLRELLSTYEIGEKEVEGDGNCMFRAISHQIYGSEKEHDVVRERTIAQLAKDPLRYRSYIVDTEYTRYVADMASNGSWGDHVTLQACSDAYGIQINLLTSFAEQPIIEIHPAVKKVDRILWLTFWAEIHYNSATLPEQGMLEANGSPHTTKEL